jgi:hypothetical protein
MVLCCWLPFRVYEVGEIRSTCGRDRRQRAPKLPSPAIVKIEITRTSFHFEEERWFEWPLFNTLPSG